MASNLRLVSEAVWVVLGQLATIAGALLLVKIVTNEIAPDQYGILALGLTVVGLTTQVSFSGYLAALGRFYSRAVLSKQLMEYKKASNKLLLSNLRRSMLVWATITLVWLKLLQGDPTLLGYIFLLAILSVANSASNIIINVARRRATNAILQSCTAWLKVLCIYIWTVFKSAPITVEDIVLCMVFALIITTSIQLMIVRKLLNTKLDSTQTSVYSEMNQFASPYFLWTLIIWMHQVSDRWALEAFGSIEQVGMYAILLQLGFAPFVQIASTAVKFAQPLFYQFYDGLQKNEAGESSHLIVAVTISLAVAAFLVFHYFGVSLFKLLVNEEYHSIAGMLKWMAFSGCLFGGSELLVSKLQAELQSRRLRITKITVGILGISLNVISAYYFGLVGLVAALVVYCTCSLLLLSLKSDYFFSSLK